MDVPDAAATVRHGAHGSAIDIVAVTANGTAAVTQDAEGNTRLWPALDASQEPIVVRAQPAAELAILARGDQHLIASLDDVGNLELVELVAGAQRARHQLRDGATVLQVATTSEWLLALRDDQTIDVRGVTGEAHGHLALPSGDRAIALAARNDHVVVIAQRDGALHATPLDVQRLAFGAASHELPLGTHFALSPGGTALVGLFGIQTKIVWLANGRLEDACQTFEPTLPQPRVPRAQLTLMPISRTHTRARPEQVPLAFLDDETVACLTFGMVHWYPRGKHDSVFELAEPHPELAAYGGDVQVTGAGLALGIAKIRTPIRYLGYRLPEPTMMRSGPLGLAVSRAGTPPLVLDPHLHAQTRIAIDAKTYEDVMAIDSRFALRTSSIEGAHVIELVDTTTEHATRIGTTTSYDLRFEPATNLLAIAGNHVASYDPQTHAFAAPKLLPVSGEIYLVDPALADGLEAIVIAPYQTHFQVHELDRTLAVTRTYEVDGDVIQVDRAGRVYVATGSEIHVYASAKRVVTLPVAGEHPIVAVDPETTRAIVIGDQKLVLFDLDGRERWAIPQHTAIDVMWDSGEPVVRFASGLARLDIHTGRLRERACGWDFELRATPPEGPGSSESVCDAE